MAIEIFGFDLGAPLPYIGVSIFDILFAVVAFLVGYIVIIAAIRIFRKSMKKTKLPELLMEFLSRLLKILLIILLILAILPILHIDVSAIVLGMSAIIGLILGFGMQDTMTNIFSGFWLAMLKPFDIGDYVEINGFGGTLHAVGVMSTTLLTPDNKFIMIPNKLVWGATIVNYTKMPKRRVDVDIDVAYGTDLDKAIGIAMEIMRINPWVLDDPAPTVVISELADSSINLQLRPWCKTSDYWSVKGEITRKVYDEFVKEGIEIPYPQMDVHINEKS